jgi:CubicO group peptidase (beta-lactamase class C family)
MRRRSWVLRAVCGALLAAVLGLGTACAQAAPPPQTPDPQEMSAWIDQFMAGHMADMHIPGAAVALVRGGDVLMAKGYGYTDRSQQQRVDPERTTFRIASVSKLFTATAVMQLVEQGRLDLHADINRYLADFQIPATYPQPITLEHLLTHTAGFDDSDVGSIALSPESTLPLGRYLATFLPPRVRPPGQIFSYSNYGMALAGYVVQQASGEPFERYIERHILEPLEMRHSGFAPGDSLATGYWSEGNAQAVRRYYVSDLPSSGLIVSAADMAGFMTAHLQGGQRGQARLLQPATAELMHQQHFTNYEGAAGVGYGFFEDTSGGTRAIWHNGALAGYRSILYLWPAAQTGLFVVSNADSDLGQALADGFQKTFFPAPPQAEGVPTYPLTAEQARRFAGTYGDVKQSIGTSLRIFSLQSQIPVTANDDGTINVQGVRFTPTGPLRFRQDGGDLAIAFREDERGQVAYLFQGLVALKRVSWARTYVFTRELALVCLLTFLVSLLVQVGRAAWRRLRGRTSDPARRQGLKRLIIRLSAVVCALNLLSAAAFWGAVTLDTAMFYGGNYPLTAVALYLPWLAGGLSLCLAVAVALAWARGLLTLGWRLRYSLPALAALVFAFWLYSWNLIGPQW